MQHHGHGKQAGHTIQRVGMHQFMSAVRGMLKYVKVFQIFQRAPSQVHDASLSGSCQVQGHGITCPELHLTRPLQRIPSKAHMGLHPCATKMFAFTPYALLLTVGPHCAPDSANVKCLRSVGLPVHTVCGVEQSAHSVAFSIVSLRRCHSPLLRQAPKASSVWRRLFMFSLCSPL